MKTSKRTIATVLVGVLVSFGVAEVGLRLAEDHLPQGTNWPTIETDVKYHQLLEEPNVDVVFLGSSITEAAIDPAIPAKAPGVGSAFNSGIPFSTPYSNEFWLEKVVLPHVDPDVVVIGLTAWSGGTGPEADPLLSSLDVAMTSDSAPGLALVEFAGLLSEWDTRRSNDLARQYLTEQGHQTGYYDRSIENSVPLDLPFGPEEMPLEEAEAVRRMIDRLGDAEIEAIVLIEPGRYPGDDGNIDYDKYIDSILEFSDYWGVPVLDTFHEGWDSSLFADLAHFNRGGTEAFTAYVADAITQLSAHWVIPQPLTDSADIA